MRRAQRSFGDGLIAEEVSDLREDWMRHADQVLADEQMVAAVYEALGKRHPKSRSRGRWGTPAEVVLRLLILKHIRNWSYGVLEREVRANLVYRDFTRVGGAKTPDAKTMGRWGVALQRRRVHAGDLHHNAGPRRSLFAEKRLVWCASRKAMSSAIAFETLSLSAPLGTWRPRPRPRRKPKSQPRPEVGLPRLRGEVRSWDQGRL